MKRLLLAILLCTASISLYSQVNRGFVSYYEYAPFMHAPESAYRYGLYGFINPAVLGMTDRSESLLIINDKKGDLFNSGSFNDVDIASFSNSSKNFGSGFIRFNDGGKTFWDYRLNLGFGNKNFAMGFGYGFRSGDNPNKFNNTYQIGMLSRPLPYFSIGYVYRANFNGQNDEHVGEFAVRPIKNYPLSFFIDAMTHKEDKYNEIYWSSGISWEFLRGIRLNGRYFWDERLSIGFDVSLGNIAFSTIASAPSANNFSSARSSYGLSTYPLDRSIIYEKFIRKDKALVMELEGTLENSFGLFGSETSARVKLLDVLLKLDEFKSRADVTDIYINITKFQASYSTMWEVRDKLAELKQSGKKIIIFSEDFSIRNYHLASVADEVIMEPMGMMMLEGFVRSRSYYQNFMEKYGLGYDEIRLFKYKSAAESYARRDFSEGEREQSQELIDDMYEFARKEIVASRGLSNDEFDNIVDDNLFITPQKAKQYKLIDTEYRWNQIDSLIKQRNEDMEIARLPWKEEDTTPYDDRWSEQNRNIAIVYANGVCDMETGIKGRELAKIMERVLADDKYEAVIFRVNSPGGSALASDYVAEVIRRFKGTKPILVSQGAVAASGGYWLSMDADTILATPMTITGSIGVIAAWIYNDGMLDSLGVSHDLVKRGKHSDLASPIALPFIGIGIPARGLSSDERQDFETMILDFYGQFVNKVAHGRGTDSSTIAEVAQGRVYTGIRGKDNGLVDEIGGIWKAIEIAKERINFKKDDLLNVDEFAPKTSNFLANLLSPFSAMFPPKKSFEDYFPALNDEIKFRLQHNGKPQYILPMDYYDFVK